MEDVMASSSSQKELFGPRWQEELFADAVGVSGVNGLVAGREELLPSDALVRYHGQEARLHEWEAGSKLELWTTDGWLPMTVLDSEVAELEPSDFPAEMKFLGSKGAKLYSTKAKRAAYGATVPVEPEQARDLYWAFDRALWIEVDENHSGGFTFYSPESIAEHAISADYDPAVGTVALSLVEVGPEWDYRHLRWDYLGRLADMGVTYFASGAQQPGDMFGFANTGHNVGATVSEYVKAAREPIRAFTTSLALENLAREHPETLVFLDSGAVKEVDNQFNTRPGEKIPPEEWERRLAVYEEVARLLGPRLSVTLPDRLGDQSLTLKRQKTHKAVIGRIRDLGAQLLVPLPRLQAKTKVKPVTLSKQFDRSSKAMGIPMEELVPSFPTRPGPGMVTPEEIADFLQDVWDRYGLRVRRVHLLGKGPANAVLLERYVNTLRAVDPEIEISCDAAERHRLAHDERFNEIGRELRADVSGSDIGWAYNALRWSGWRDAVANLDRWLTGPRASEAYRDITEYKERPRTAAAEAAFVASPLAWLNENLPDDMRFIKTIDTTNLYGVKSILWSHWVDRISTSPGISADQVHQLQIEEYLRPDWARVMRRYRRPHNWRTSPDPSALWGGPQVLILSQVDLTDAGISDVMYAANIAAEKGYQADVRMITADRGVAKPPIETSASFGGFSDVTIRRLARAQGTRDYVHLLMCHPEMWSNIGAVYILLDRENLIAANLAGHSTQGDEPCFSHGPVVFISEENLDLVPTEGVTVRVVRPDEDASELLVAAVEKLPSAKQWFLDEVWQEPLAWDEFDELEREQEIESVLKGKQVCTACGNEEQLYWSHDDGSWSCVECGTSLVAAVDFDPWEGDYDVSTLWR
jgi:hypothetical protein